MKQNKFWSRKFKLQKCKKCRRDKFKHRQNGLCNSCWSKKRYRDPVYKAWHKKYVVAWNKKHPKKHLEIQARAYKKYRAKIIAVRKNR